MLVAGIVGVFLFIPGKERGRISVEITGKTNVDGVVFGILSASNGTDRVYAFASWGEWSFTGDRWASARRA